MKIRKGTKGVDVALATQLNALRDAMVGTNFHAQATPSGPPPFDVSTSVATLAVGAANASSLATSITLANDVLRVLQEHFKDMAAHKSVQSPVLALSDLASTALIATVVTRVNALKAAYEAHRVLANVHFTNDTTNTISAVDATDQTSVNTLLNELKTDINAHIAGALAGQHVELVDA